MGSRASGVAYGVIVTRWLARGLSMCSLGLLVSMMVGYRANPVALVWSTGGLFLFFPLGVMVGMLLAWRWEIAGGLVAVLSLALFYGIHALQSGRWPGGPFFALVTLPAALFLVSGTWRRWAGGGARGPNP